MYKTNAQNLVPNCSFENYSSCPIGGSSIYLATPWISPTTISSTDYYNVCAGPSSGVSIPSNIPGYQYAKNGVAYAGFYTFLNNNSREYIQVELTDSLKKNQSYCVQFYVNLANEMQYATTTVGAYFSKTAVSNTKDSLLPYVPQIINTSANPLTDTLGWTLISGNFIAAKNR